MKKTIVLNGVDKQAELVDVVTASEPWSTLLLADGTRLRVKLVVTEVWRLLDEVNAAGEPVYVIHSTNVMNVQAGEHGPRHA